MTTQTQVEPQPGPTERVQRRVMALYDDVKAPDSDDLRAIFDDTQAVQKAVDLLRAIVSTWEAQAEDTIGENVLALSPLIFNARAILDALASESDR